MDQAGSGGPDFPYGFTASTGTVTGILTAATYDITDMNISGVATVSGTTVSTSTTTGALTVSGGAGIAKSVYIGENLDVGGSLSVGGTITYDDIHNLDSIGVVTARSGIEVTAGGISVNGGGLDIVGVTTGIDAAGVSTFATLITTATLTVSDTTQSTGKDSGAIILNGGIGCEKNLNVGLAVTMEGLGISTFSGGMKVGGGSALREKFHINSTAWSASVAAGDINLDYGNVHLNTANLAGTGNTLNVTSGVGINSIMTAGDTIAVTGVTAVNATTAFVNTLKIDHTAVTVSWVNGTTPSAGGSSGYDTYAFNIFKTGDAAYVVVGSHIKTS